MQIEKSLSSEIVDSDGNLKPLKDVKYEFVKVPKTVINRRQEVVLAYDKQILQETLAGARNCLVDNVCDAILVKRGEEILSSLKCVGFLNAPQTNENHLGYGRLYLTKRASSGAKSYPNYRLFYYCYGITSKATSHESSEVRSSQWIEFFEDYLLVNVVSKRGFASSLEHQNERNLKSDFISISMDDVFSAFHRVDDYTDIKARHLHENVHTFHFRLGKFRHSKCPRMTHKLAQ